MDEVKMAQLLLKDLGTGIHNFIEYLNIALFDECKLKFHIWRLFVNGLFDES